MHEHDRRFARSEAGASIEAKGRVSSDYRDAGGKVMALWLRGRAIHPGERDTVVSLMCGGCTEREWGWVVEPA